MGKAYLLSGDPFLVEEELLRLRKELLPFPSPWNEFLFDGETPGKPIEEQVREIIAVLQTPPLFGGSSLVLVRRAWIGGGRKRNTNPEETGSLEDNVSEREELASNIDLFDILRPLAAIIDEQKEFPNNLLLVAPPGVSPAKSNPIVKAIQRQGNFIEKEGFNPYRPQEIVQWLIRLGYDIEPSAARMLVERVGPHTFTLKNAMEVLYLFSRGGKITSFHVETLIRGEEEDALRLYDAMNKKDPVQALQILRELLKQPQSHPLQLLSMLTTFYRRALAVKKLQEQARFPDQVVAALKGREEEQKNDIRLFKRSPTSSRDLYLYLQKCPFSCKGLIQILQELLTADKKLKSNSDPETVFLFLFQRSARLE